MQLELESFNGFVTAQLLQRFTQLYPFVGGSGGSSGVIVAAGPRGNTCYRVAGSYSHRKVVVPGNNVYNRGFRFNQSTGAFANLAVNVDTGSSTYQNNALIPISYLGTVQCWFQILTNGKIQLVRGAFNPIIGGGAATVVAGPSTLALSVATWHNIRVKVTVHPSAGTAKLVVNGVTWFDQTGLNTAQQGTAAWDEWWMPGIVKTSGTQQVWDIADDYLADGVSGDSFNDIMPALRVNPYYALAEGAHVDGTPNTGSDRANNVKEGSFTGGTGPDSDTTYNVLSATGNKDSFTHDAVDPTSTIKGVQIKGFIRKESDGDALVKLGTRRLGADSMGAAQGVASTYQYLVQNLGYDPATAAAWVTANFNNSELVHEKSV